MFRTYIISTIASCAHTLNYSIYLESVSIIFLPYTKRPGSNGANCLQDFPMQQLVQCLEVGDICAELF